MMARSPAVALDSAYFPNEDVSTSFDLPPVTPSRNRRLLDDTLPLAGHDVSDASFQIPIAANASNLMTDDDFLQRNPDVCATPYVPLTLSQLTPSAKHFARDLEEEASTPTATPRRHATPKFKPRPTPHRQHGTPTSAAFIPMQNSPGRQRRVPSKATPTPPTADMPDESGIDRLAMMKQEVENLMKSTEPSESAVVLPKPLVPASTARPKSLRAKSAAPTAGVSKLKKPPSRSRAVPKKPVSDTNLRSRTRSTQNHTIVSAGTSTAAEIGTVATKPEAASDDISGLDGTPPTEERDIRQNTYQTAPIPAPSTEPLTLSQLSPVKEAREGNAEVLHNVGRWAPEEGVEMDIDATPPLLAKPLRGRSPSPMRASTKRPLSPEPADEADRPAGTTTLGPSSDVAQGRKKGKTQRTGAPAAKPIAPPPRTRATVRREAATRPPAVAPSTRRAVPRPKPRSRDVAQGARARSTKASTATRATDEQMPSSGGRGSRSAHADSMRAQEGPMDVDDAPGRALATADTLSSGSGSALPAPGTQRGAKPGQLAGEAPEPAGPAYANEQAKAQRPQVGMRTRLQVQAQSGAPSVQNDDNSPVNGRVFVFQGTVSNSRGEQTGPARAPPKPTVPVEFNFSLDARMSTRRTELEGSRSSNDSSTRGPAPRPVPDFPALQAAHAASVAAHRAAAVQPVVPEPFELRLETRAREREAFEEARREREMEAEQIAEQQRLEREEEEAREYQEARRKAVPKANPVPEWYRDAPKRKRE